MPKTTFEFHDLEKAKLSIYLDAVAYDRKGNCNYINSLNKLAYEALPKELLDIFLRQKNSKTPLPYILIENVPTDSAITAVPLQNECASRFKTGSRSESLLIMLSSLLGEPYSMVFEGAEIVNNLIPYKETAKHYTGLGSNVELDFHIENAALKHFSPYNFSPMGLMLTGVNLDENGPVTRVSDGRQALTLLSEEEQEILSSHLFRIKVPHRWRSEKYGIPQTETEWVPILHNRNGAYPELSAVFYKDMIKAKTPEAQNALNKLHKAVKTVSVGISLKPGQLLYIDNRFALHSRDMFEPTIENGRPKRWVQRVFVSPNLWGHRNLHEIDDRIYEVKAC
ncbi:TauD/TfdA family dioxygenase [Marinomonas sp. TI.3.20]|uniref:TauD/TfdA family dioxygenase n=1 Tax=Marinomonas sp. TI.3.20 TaxID=3121296 RepID=UPI00311E3050